MDKGSIMTAQDITKALINRVRSLREFEVSAELPEDFAINGYIPFHLIIRDGVLTARVMAVSKEDAQDQVERFIESQS
jgi:hypothetical protein